MGLSISSKSARRNFRRVGGVVLVARGHGEEGQDSRGSLFAVLELLGHPYAGRQVIKEISIKKKKKRYISPSVVSKE